MATLRATLALPLAAVLGCASARPAPASEPSARPPAASPSPAPMASASPSSASPRLTSLPVPETPCVADEPTPLDPPRAVSAPDAASDGRAPARIRALCTALLARNATRLHGHADLHHVAASLWCHPTATGAWATALERLGETHENGVDGPMATVQVQWIPAHGAPVTLAARQTVRDAGPYWDEILAGPVFDWNGDGTPEVVLEVHSHMTEEDDGTTRRVLTVADGHVVPYARTPQVISGFADVDGDGRPDPGIPSPIGLTTNCGLNGSYYGGPATFARSLPDGRFSDDAPVIRALIRRACGTFDPSARVLSSDTGRSVMAIACARYHGVPSDALAERIRAEYPTRNGSAPGEGDGTAECTPLDMLLQTAAMPLPFVLPPRCPVSHPAP